MVNRLLAGGTEIRHGEGESVLATGLLFFLLLTTIMILRPVREAFGLSGGGQLEEQLRTLRVLFLVNVGATVLVVPLFGWLVSRVSRRRLVSVSFRICAVILLAFLAGLTFFPDPVCRVVKAVYYVYHSVFNLFVVSLFWAFMADVFSLSESKRLFPAIAIGGTLGAIFGSLIPLLAQQIDVRWFFLIAAGSLELAVWAATLVTATRGGTAVAPRGAPPIGGHAFAGITAVVRSPYILGIAAFVGLVGVASTFFYFTQLKLVAEARESDAARTALFANINIWTQVATLVVQAFLTGRIMRVAGVATALAILPGLAAGGFAVLASVPLLPFLVPLLPIFMIVNAVFRAAQQGITRPARETLFTVLAREQKYKAKSFLDTFCFRAGDATGAGAEWLLAAAAPGLVPLAITVFPLAGAWIWLSSYLGRTQSRLADAESGPALPLL
jgi:AAA family ATP:ADP antiporter